MKNFTYLKILLMLLIFSSFSILHSQSIIYGDSASLGDGIIKAWIKTDASNNPESIGLAMTEEVLMNLPADPIAPFHLNLPKTTSDTLFNHLYFGWNPAGHPPPQIYGLPHFDLHYYIISKEERLAILGGPDSITVEPRFAPPDYVSDPAGVPMMGTHWVDTTALEFHGQTFDKTMIYGYAKGKLAFLEPMFTKAYLESHPHFTGNIKQPTEFQRAGYYPTAFKIDYDTVNHVYNFEITDMIWHDAAAPVGVEETENNSLPEKFALNQNYPNPFNPSTKISYSLKTEGRVSLKIYNTLGEEVIKLVDEIKPAGSYETEFNASELPSGIYIYRMQSGEYVSSKKMLLIK